MYNKNQLDQKIQLIINNFRANKFENVILQSKKLLRLYPNHEYLLNMIGLCYQNLNQVDEATKIFIKILQLNPSNYVAKNNYARLLKSNNQIVKAKEILEDVIKKIPNYVAATNNLANLYKEIGNYDEAIKLYEKIIDEYMKSKNDISKEQISILQYNLALCYQQIGKKDESLIEANNSLELNQNLTQNYIIISSLTNYSNPQEKQNLESMRNQLQNTELNPLQKVPIYFSLGKAYEDKKEYNDSFENYKLANSTYRKLINYDFDEEIVLFNKIKKTFQNDEVKELFASNNNNFSKKNIFICGMPRSGTTLIEQIISTHNQVDGLGETEFIARIFSNNFKNSDWVNSIKELYLNDKNKPNNDYFEMIKLLNLNKNVYTDKSLFNFKYIGFIRIFFPNSKIIISKRDYKNNFLSIFKNYLPAIKWSFDEKEIKKFNDLYEEYINLWNELMPNYINEVSYENLIENHQEKIKEIIHFCELDWDPNCLEFYSKNKKPIQTASVNQANKPIYKDSVDKFSNFKKYFE